MTRWIAPCSTVVRPVPSVSVLTNNVSAKSVVLLGALFVDHVDETRSAATSRRRKQN